jgi:hypothetical protein
MILVLAVSIVIVGMETGRIAWHGILRRDPGCLAVHLLGIGFLMAYAGPWWPVGLLSLAAAVASYVTLKWWDDLSEWWDKHPGTFDLPWRLNIALRLFRRRWPGWDVWHLTSMLSALPIQVAAVLAVSWALPGWWRWAALGWFGALGIWVKFWLWKRPWLRPSRWN